MDSLQEPAGKVISQFNIVNPFDPKLLTLLISKNANWN